LSPMAMDQSEDATEIVNPNLTFVHTNQRTKYDGENVGADHLRLSCSLINESGNDGTWLTVFGLRAHADALTLIDTFSELGVIEKYLVRHQ
jgi:hypothetical protein